MRADKFKPILITVGGAFAACSLAVIAAFVRCIVELAARFPHAGLLRILSAL